MSTDGVTVDTEFSPSLEEESLLFTCAEAGERLDVFLTARTELTRSFIKKLTESGDVLVNGSPVKSGTKLKKGDSVELVLPPPEPVGIMPADIPISIVFEDEHIAVIDKEKGMVVHPAPGHTDDTLVNALMFRLKDLSGIGGELRPGIVHRIDRLTSGLIVVAKNDAAHNALARQIKEHSARRTYIALVEGNFREDSGTVNAPIARHRTDRKKMAVDPSGRDAVTHWEVLRRFGQRTLLRVRLETGRTHQIRVHMAHIKHPVTGDDVYGKAAPRLDGQALHASRLELTHPATGERMEFRAKLPEWFAAELLRLGMSEDEINGI